MDNTINNIVSNRRNLVFMLLGIVLIALLLGTALGITISNNISMSHSGTGSDADANTSTRLNQLEAEIDRLILALDESKLDSQELTVRLNQTDENYQNVLSDLIESQTDLALKELNETSQSDTNLGSALYEKLDSTQLIIIIILIYLKGIILIIMLLDYVLILLAL